MSSSGDTKDLGKLSCNAVGVDALNVPKCFWIPGTASIFHGYFGAGGIAGYGQGSLVAAPGPFPFTSQMYGVNNVIGSHIVNGVRITNGVDLMTGGSATVATAIWKCYVGSASINAGKVEIDAAKGIEMAAAKEIMLSAAKSVDLISGTDVFIDGRPWSLASELWDSKKPFDILHPTKEGHRLRYVCLEGPAAEVYVRGELKGSNIIELPDHWKGLVDEKTIGVSLTSIGTHQELFVEKIDDYKIFIKNSASSAIRCHYIVYGERKDTSKNITEYKGLTPTDYPGDNSEYNLTR